MDTGSTYLVCYWLGKQDLVYRNHISQLCMVCSLHSILFKFVCGSVLETGIILSAIFDRTYTLALITRSGDRLWRLGRSTLVKRIVCVQLPSL